MTAKNLPNPDPLKYERIGDSVSIYLRDGVWYGNFQHEGKQRRRSLRTRSKKEARRQAIQLEADIHAGRYEVRTKAPSVHHVIDAYQRYLQTETRADKTRGKAELIGRRLLELAEQRRVKSILGIDLQFVDAYRAKRAAEGAGARTRFNETVILRQVVNFALRRRMITVDPLAGLTLKKVKSRRQPCWTRSELESILAASNEAYRPSLTLLAETGVRIGELKHLTWDDIDLTRGVIVIRAKDGWRPKTGEERIVSLSGIATAVLRSLPRRCRWVVTAPPSSTYPAGDHQISERRLLQHLKRVVEGLGLPGHLHTFRHSFVTNALLKGIPEAVVREWVGHLDPDVTKLYTHVSNDASAAAMQRLTEANSKELQEKGSPK